MKAFLITLLLTCAIFAQKPYTRIYNAGIYMFYLYTPVTDTAVNITQYSALVKGDNDKVKSDKFDTLATNRSVQNWIVVGVDSLQGLTRQLTGLSEDTEYSYYHSILVRANDGDTDYYKGTTKTFTTISLPEGNLLATEDGNFVITEDGNYIKFEE